MDVMYCSIFLDDKTDTILLVRQAWRLRELLLQRTKVTVQNNV